MKAGDKTLTTVVYKGYIYAVYCWATKQRYIGSTVNFKTRMDNHKCLLRASKHHSQILQNAWDLYGEECFEFNLLQEYKHITILELRDLELEFIKEVDCINIVGN